LLVLLLGRMVLLLEALCALAHWPMSGAAAYWILAPEAWWMACGCGEGKRIFSGEKVNLAFRF